MKISKTQKSAISNLHSSEPFFNKSGEFNFFSKSKKSKQPFFCTYPIQTKQTLGKPNDVNEQKGDRTAEKIVQGKQFLPQKLTPVVPQNNKHTIQRKPKNNCTRREFGLKCLPSISGRLTLKSRNGIDFTSYKIEDWLLKKMRNSYLFANKFNTPKIYLKNIQSQLKKIDNNYELITGKSYKFQITINRFINAKPIIKIKLLTSAKTKIRISYDDYIKNQYESLRSKSEDEFPKSRNEYSNAIAFRQATSFIKTQIIRDYFQGYSGSTFTLSMVGKNLSVSEYKPLLSNKSKNKRNVKYILDIPNILKPLDWQVFQFIRVPKKANEIGRIITLEFNHYNESSDPISWKFHKIRPIMAPLGTLSPEDKIEIYQKELEAYRKRLYETGKQAVNEGAEALKYGLATDIATAGIVSGVPKGLTIKKGVDTVKTTGLSRASTKRIPVSKLKQAAEKSRLLNKYKDRTRTSYPPEVWAYIEQLEKAFPGLKGANLRPMKRPNKFNPANKSIKRRKTKRRRRKSERSTYAQDKGHFEERMRTSQGSFSYRGTLRDGREIQLDDITLFGVVIENKYRSTSRIEGLRKAEDQMERLSLFAKENGLIKVNWEVNNFAALRAYENILIRYHKAKQFHLVDRIYLEIVP